MASQQTNEIDDLIKGLRGNPGFKAYIVLNNDGVVLRWDQEGSKMPYEKAVQYSHHVLDLYDKGARQMNELFDAEDNNIENIRLRTKDYELIAAQEGDYILVVLYNGGNKAETSTEDDEE
eukprot:scaffold927_cov240-Chaetoceros_neogracile.AAC.5